MAMFTRPVNMFSFFVLLFVLTECKGLLNCNEAVCASIVSKCMLTQSCKCDAKNSTCSRDCYHCLDYLFSECCSCVEMCKNDEETDEKLSSKSHVELLSEPIDQLFNALTEAEDSKKRWVSYTFPSRTTFITHSNDKEIKITASTVDNNNPLLEDIQLNCSVLFMTQCLPYEKCKGTCQSTGATSYRWFHDGCCECIGSNCLNFGIQTSSCENCPPKETVLETDNDEVSSNTAIDEDEETIQLSNSKDILEHPKEGIENSAVIDNLQSVD